ncbi:hypothetical protein SLS53_002817 [Cytospora paraplurivora]|uniref:COX assembly mitochondrial protein n=1 Tax=Cytospora paraplurivora TaxID=2898453 RepID=A0AAN9UE57_9PEZI
MHPHLHTKDNLACEDLMSALEECHDKGFLWKSMGMCNGAKEALGKCLRGERRKRQDFNRNKSQDKKEAVKLAWKEIDENS